MPKATTLRTELLTARRVMANLLSEAERSAVQAYIADLERELATLHWNGQGAMEGIAA